MLRNLLSTLVIISILLSLSACVVLEPDFNGPKAWLLSSYDRVDRAEWETLDQRVISGISAAKGEWEGVQLNIRAPRSGLKNVLVSVSPFSNDTFTLPAPKLFRKHYVFVDRAGKRGSPLNENVPLGRGWYADALVPFEAAGTTEIPSHPFQVNARQNQPIYIDVFVPEDAPAGIYESRYTIESSEGLVSGTLSLEVWDFTLAKTPSLKSSFLIWDEKTPQMRDLLLEHKLMPRSTPPLEQAPRLASNGLNSVDLRFWSGTGQSQCTMPNPPSVAEIKERLADFDERLLIYNYTADEIDRCEGITEQVKAWGRNLHEAGVPQLIVMFPQRELFDDGTGRSAVDIWVFTPELYLTNNDSQAILDEALAISDAWSYTALMELDDTPKWGIDYLPLNYRIMQGFMNHRYDLTGFLYWRVNLWQSKPWRDVTHPIDTYPAGEGMLTYPGTDIGITDAVPSLRLKWIRDGVEDFEYVQMLRDLGQEQEAQEIISSAAKDWRNWTKDPKVLEGVKAELAQAIVEASP